MIGPQLTRSQEVSFTEADGTRLAHAWHRRAAAAGCSPSQQLLDLPGNTMVLRMDSWRARARPVPQRADGAGHRHVDRAGAGAVAAGARRAPAPARRARPGRRAGVSQGDGGFAGHRPARARPAGPHHLRQSRLSARWWASRAEELLGHATPAPYWPPELADEYQKRQEIRLAGQHAPPREGFESVFMRKDGSRFPVLIIEAPLINHDGRADRLDERLPGHQRAAPRARNCRAPARSGCRPRRGWRRSARWPRC